jgi:hypothetical protein
LDIPKEEPKPAVQLLPLLLSPPVHLLSEALDIADLPAVPLTGRTLRAAIPIYKTQQTVEQTVYASRLAVLERQRERLLPVMPAQAAVSIPEPAKPDLRALALTPRPAGSVSEDRMPLMASVASRPLMASIEAPRPNFAFTADNVALQSAASTN